jgi:hypothetical protein
LTLEVVIHLGICLGETNQLAEASALLERALALRRSAGETPTAVAEAALALAKVSWSARKLERARALTEEAAALWRRDGGNDAAEAAERWLAARSGVSPG